MSARVTLSPAQLGTLFPAFILTDPALRVISVGPAVQERFADLTPGCSVDDHFRVEPADWTALLPGEGEAGCAVRLFSLHRATQLGGSAIAVDGGYLLAVNLMPSVTALDSDELRMADFAPSDPLVPALMLVALQRQMLEDAHRTAAELDRERGRNAELWHRVSRVAGHMAHDFANVFSIIVMNARRLGKEGRLSADDRRLARIIERTVERGSIATHSLMTISQQQHDSPAPASPDRIIRDNLHFLSTIAGPMITVTLDLEAGAEVCSVSRSGLVHVIVDLVVHARDSMPGGGSIVIATRRVDPPAADGAYVDIRIDGCAADLSGKALAWASAPLPLHDQARNDPDLLTVEEFTRAAGGKLVRESATPDHLAFVIRLPVLAASCQTGETATHAGIGSGEETTSHVLVVEDEPFALEAITELLTEDGFAVTPAPDAEAALMALRQDSHDVLLSDVILPGMSGVELAHRVTAEHPHVKVILMSGYVPDQRAMQSGWQFLRKPIDVTMLRRLLHSQ